MTDQTTPPPNWDSPAELWRYYSTKLMLLLTAAAEYLMFLTPEELAKLVAQYPTVSKAIPIAAFVAWLAARAKKQS